MQPNTNQMAQTSYNQGQQLQNLFNTQAGQATGQYQNSLNNAYTQQGALQQFNKTMANPQDLYNKALSGSQQMYGFNPLELAKAQKALAVTNTTMANLPQAIQQQGNYYGTTAGSQANNYAQQAGVLNAVQQGQANTVGQYQALLKATQDQAAQGAQFGVQGEQLRGQNYQALAQNATSIMNQAGVHMRTLEQLAQQQGGLTASQQTAYAQAYQTYTSANTTAAQLQSQLNVMHAQQDYYKQIAGAQQWQNQTGAPAQNTWSSNGQYSGPGY